MMAISVEHLGAQVQCPHCAAVVQTPPRSALGGPPPGPDPTPPTYQPPIQYQPPPPPQQPAYQPPAYQPPPQQPAYQEPAYQPPAYQPPMLQDPPQIKVPERESIFADPEPVDDLFGEEDAPKVQMPEPRVGVAEREAVRAGEPTLEPVDDEPEEEHVPRNELSAAQTRLAKERKKAGIAPMLLVFLIPYSIFTTAFIAYLLVTWQRLESFEWLPDPKQKNAAKFVELPKHDLPMPAKLQVALNQSIRVGSMEITPLEVSKTENGLQLEFKAKNLSSNQMIIPIEEEGFFFKVGKGARPYTFLEQVGNKEPEHRIYNGDLQYVRGKDRLGDYWLKPGEEAVIKLSTEETEGNAKKALGMLAHTGKFQWRLQIRRGLETVHRTPTSLTAVIGVEFDRKDIKGV